MLVIEGMFDTGLSVLLDTFSTANDLSSASESSPHFRVQVAAVRKRVTTQQGFQIPVIPAAEIGQPDDRNLETLLSCHSLPYRSE